MNTVDFTDVNIYPKHYWYNIKNGVKDFKIKSFIIESITSQLNVLLRKKTQLLLGDLIKVDTKFGHNISKKTEPENWIDVSISGYFKVTGIEPLPETNEILLWVKECKPQNIRLIK